MATDFPGAVDTFDTRAIGQTIQPDHVNELQDGMVAVQEAVLDVRISNVIVGSGQSSSANATKGCMFTPSRDLKLYGLYFCGDLTAGGTYRAYVATISGGAIATLTNGADVVPGTSVTDSAVLLPFATPVTLTSGTAYALMVGRRDGADNFALPVTFAITVTDDLVAPGTWGDSVTVTEATPIVTTAATQTAFATQLRPGYIIGF